MRRFGGARAYTHIRVREEARVIEKNMTKQRGNSILSPSVTTQTVQQRILVVRGQQVLMDFQLAQLYGVETRVLKQAVRRNIERFPEDFMFRLTQDEANWLISNGRSQFVIPENYNFSSSTPFAFTEQGVAMLSSVLRTPTAVQINIEIMRAFIMARRLLVQNQEHEMAINELRMKMQMLEDALENNLGAVNDLSEEMRREIENIYNAIGALSVKQQELPKPKPMNPIGFNSPIYDDRK